VADRLVPVWLPWGHGRSPGPRLAAVEAWPVPWGQRGRRAGVVGPLASVWLRGGVAGPLVL